MDREMTPGEYAVQHKKAFRAAFDYLTEHFPPGDTAEWWDVAAKDVSIKSMESGEGKLVINLLIGVYDYLDHIRGKRKEKEHGGSGGEDSVEQFVRSALPLSYDMEDSGNS